MIGNKKVYENKVILLFFFAWGFLFLDRASINFIYPTILEDLELTNAQVGIINMGFTIAWAVSSIIFSSLADKSQNLKKWLMVTGILTSLCGLLCFFANSFISLVLLRLLVGVVEGPFYALLIAVAGRSIDSGRRGFAIGAINGGAALVGFAVGPIIMTQLVAVTTWNMAFLISATPGLITMLIIGKFVRPIDDVEKKEDTQATEIAEKQPKKNIFAEIFGNRTYQLMIIVGIFDRFGYFLLVVYGSLYWTDVAGLSLQTVGFLTSAYGFVNIAESFIIPKLSDNLGRKPTMGIGYVLCALAPLTMWLMPGSPISMVMFVLFGLLPGVLGVFWIHIVPMDVLRPQIVTTAMATALAIGEITGGAIVTPIAGVIADKYGYPTIMAISTIGLFLAALLVAVFFKESAPQILKKRAEKAAASEK
jgi:predicted MFS family arabinose efflux permease